MKYLLDTDACIHALKHDARVLSTLTATPRGDVAMSVVTEAELRTGAEKSDRRARTLRLLERFLAPIAILDFTSADAATYARVRAALERAGTPIGPLDTLIAAQAVGRGLILVTSNEREFRRVTGLTVENWRR